MSQAGKWRKACDPHPDCRRTPFIMDVNLPDMNGIEATVHIKRQQPTTIVIGLSVNADQQSIAAMLGAGAAMLITKEAAVNDLYDAVKRAWKPADDAGAVLHGR